MKNVKKMSNVKKFEVLEEWQKQKILEEQFRTAIRYVKEKKGEITYEVWIEEMLEKLGLGMLEYGLDSEGNFKIKKTGYDFTSGEKSLKEIVDKWIEQEQNQEEKEMLQRMGQIIDNVLLLWVGEEYFPSMDYNGEKKKVEIRLTELVNNTDYKTIEEVSIKIEQMQKIIELDEDYPKIKIKEIKLKTLYGANEEAFFDIDYTNEKYLSRCEHKLRELEPYIIKKVKQKEKEVTEKIKQEKLYEKIEKQLNKEGKIFDTKITKSILLSTGGYG